MSEANGEDVVLDDWAKSKTKAILESMIIKGEIPEEDWPPASVYKLKDEFKKTHYKRQFVSGLRIDWARINTPNLIQLLDFFHYLLPKLCVRFALSGTIAYSFVARIVQFQAYAGASF
jgi:hypothetical protein